MSQADSQADVKRKLQLVFESASQGTLSLSELSHLGKMLMEARNYELATALYKTWLANTKSPLLCIVWTDLGDALLATNDVSGARQAYQNALQLNPHYDLARAALAKLPPR